MLANRDFLRAWWGGLATTAALAASVITIWAVAPRGLFLRIVLTLVVILFAALPAVWVLSRNRERARVDPRVAVLKADLELITEWLDGWRLKGDFYRLLVEHPVDKRIPMRFSSEPYDRERLWASDMDPRVVIDPVLAERMNRVKTAVDGHLLAIDRNMFSSRDSGGDADPDWLYVPWEWPNDKRQAALQELSGGRDEFTEALRELFGAMDRAQREVRLSGNHH